MKRRALLVPSKRKYVRGVRPKVDCILCAVRRGDPKVDRLLLATDNYCYVTMNLFPYNPGHLMVVPNRHVVDVRECTREERDSMREWTDTILDLLDEVYAPSGYNVGYNLGRGAGASIEHLHLHIVPRFKNEIGFMDVIGGTRIHVDHPSKALALLRKKLKSRNDKKKGGYA